MSAASGLRRARAFGTRCAGPVTLAGLGALGAYTARMRSADRLLAQRKAQGRADDRATFGRTPRVSVLVAAWEERELLDRHVRSVLGLGYPNLEYVLCAGGADGTYDRARRYARAGVTILEQRPGEGKQRALRRCLERATGEVIFFTDADCILDDATFERTIAPLVDAGEVAATGTSAPLPEQRTAAFVLHQWAVDLYARARGGEYVAGLIGRNAAVRADVLRACGALDHPVATGTDYYLARRLLAAGHRIRFVQRSEVQSHFETDPRRYLRQQSRWLKNIVVHGRREGAWVQVGAVARAYGTGVAALTLPLLAPLLGALVPAIWGLGLVYTVLNRVRYLRFAADTRQLGISPATYLASVVYGPLDLAVLAYGLGDLITSERRRRW